MKKNDMEKIYVHQIRESLDEKCWRLSSQLLSQYDINDMIHPRQEPWCIFGNQFKQSFENIFFKELIELSALIRALMDINDIEMPKEVARVGLLETQSKKNDLTFREACNKIIHSKRHSIDFQYSKTHPLNDGIIGYEDIELEKFKNPVISTKGERNGKEWIANIEFFKFIDIAMSLPEF